VKKIKRNIKGLDWKLWIGLLISVFFSYLAFRNVDVSQMWTVIRSANPFSLVLIVIITFLQYVIRAWRWDILLEPIKKTGFSNRFTSVLIGFAANSILPARLGEFVRANYIGHQEGIKSSSALGTLVVERLFDGFTLLLILMIGVMGTTFPEQWQSISKSLRGTGFILLAGYVLIIVFIIGFKYKADSFLSIFDRLLFFLPSHFRLKIRDTIWNFSLGLVLVKDPMRIFQTICFSFLLWFSALCQIEFTEQSIGLNLPFIATFLIMAMASLGVMIPSAPGFIGTFHLAVQYGFMFYGISKELALSAAILWHAAMIFPTIIAGFIVFIVLHISPSKLSSRPDILKEV